MSYYSMETISQAASVLINIVSINLLAEPYTAEGRQSITCLSPPLPRGFKYNNYIILYL